MKLTIETRLSKNGRTIAKLNGKRLNLYDIAIDVVRERDAECINEHGDKITFNKTDWLIESLVVTKIQKHAHRAAATIECDKNLVVGKSAT